MKTENSITVNPSKYYSIWGAGICQSCRHWNWIPVVCPNKACVHTSICKFSKINIWPTKAWEGNANIKRSWRIIENRILSYPKIIRKSASKLWLRYGRSISCWGYDDMHSSGKPRRCYQKNPIIWSLIKLHYQWLSSRVFCKSFGPSEGIRIWHENQECPFKSIRRINQIWICWSSPNDEVLRSISVYYIKCRCPSITPKKCWHIWKAIRSLNLMRKFPIEVKN